MTTTHTELGDILTAGVLLMLRMGSAIVTMPVFNSPGIPSRIKAMLTLVLTTVLTPVAAFVPGVHLALSGLSMLGEVTVGLGFGVTLSLLSEAILFAAQLMSTTFSFSLANLLDPNSMVETEVLGTTLTWLGVLVLLAAGLHRTMLGAVMRTLTTVPLGCASVGLQSGLGFAAMASSIFASGVQLAAPIVSAALLIEVAVGIVSRMAPALPAQIASVPIKTLVSYFVLIGSLALWPRWIEHHFTLLLDAAERSVRA
jgi:flagellar biosynthetic protein FliR